MLSKQLMISLALTSSVAGFAQLSGGLESNAAWYINDSKIKLEEIEARHPFRSNNYLRLDYGLKRFSAGVQLEAYAPKALLNYSPELKKAGLGTYYVTYKSENSRLEITAGHFYDQFGSGLVFRTWEDRPLGIANSIAGGRIKYAPLSSVQLTGFYGKQRNGLGFDFANAGVGGLNADIELSSLLKIKEVKFGLGASYINRKEKASGFTGLGENTFLTSVRSDFAAGGFTADIEYAFKSKDALVEFKNIRPELQFDGDAYLLNLGFSKKGFGITTNLRRLENFSLFSQRNLAGNAFNDARLNYIPALTKQYDYSLTNIYVYASQPALSFEPDRNKAGEIGGQADLFFQLKKGSTLGGRTGTLISLNYSQWHGLKGRYDALQRKYAAQGFGFGAKYYRDASIEVRKKWSKKWSSAYTYLNQYYNARYVVEETGEVNAHTFVMDNTWKLSDTASVRWELQHQWAQGGFQNWGAFLFEYNPNRRWSFFATDLYNYGNEIAADRLHYYNVGGAFNTGPYRVQASYGRQRGGLVCVGGVCRYVSQNAGLSLQLNYSF